MRVLVLGSNGFLGGHVSNLLGNLGHTIIGADIIEGGGSNHIFIDPIQPDFERVFQTANADFCVNCTGAASVPESFSNPHHDYILNTLRIAQMLEAIRMVSAHTKFVHFSSAAVYGGSYGYQAIKEDVQLKPLSPYGWHKKTAEDICREYSCYFGLGTISLRVFSAYGPNLRKQLFWDLYQKVSHQSKVELFGTGQEARDFIYVEDLVNALSAILLHGDFDGRAVNVASGTATKIETAAHLFLDSLGSKKEIIFTGAERAGDPSYWQADISYLKSVGFSPQFDLQSGLSCVADWLRSL